MTRAAAGALSLVLPTWCAGCDLPDVVLCTACRDALSPHPTRRSLSGLPVCAGLEFAGIPARVVRAYKEDGRTGLARALAPALAAAARDVLDRAAAGVVVVVPVPTSPAAMRRRGYRVVDLLAARAGLHPQRVLKSAGRARDQRGLGVDQREQNVAGTLQVPRRHTARVDGRAVLLIDDVVTTGATLREAARALIAAGATLVGAATVASTPRTFDDTARRA